MRRSVFVSRIAFVYALLLGLLPASLLSFQAKVTTGHVFVQVRAAKSLSGPLNGRLLVFLKAGAGDTEVDTNEFKPSETWVAAREVHDWQAGTSVEVDADAIAFPKGFSALPAANYELQAVLDVDHTYNYGGRSANDWVSSVTPEAGWKPGGGFEPVLILDHHADGNSAMAAAIAKYKSEATADAARLEEFQSPMLTRFWGRAMTIKAWVILPPGYNDQSSTTYPTAYWTHGFGGSIDGGLITGMRIIHARMAAGAMPPMIWVMLDESIPQGTHEFADSVNNGPWGAALTTEFIPYLEAKYHMDAKVNSRFLNGHSSGGWATLQLQVNYPKVFGGTWSTSPDPSDFHDFTGSDLYQLKANVYRKADGAATPIFRDKGKIIATTEQFARLEDTLGDYGGQMRSFDWVFSPKGPDGAPEPMFDRETGDVDPIVVEYWRQHYDLAHILETHWAERGDELKGRIHLWVGTADTFYLDGAAHKFEAVLNKLGADPHFTYVPDRTHFDLYRVGQDGQGLFNEIAAQMYAVARPGVDWKKK